LKQSIQSILFENNLHDWTLDAGYEISLQESNEILMFGEFEETRNVPDYQKKNFNSQLDHVYRDIECKVLTL